LDDGLILVSFDNPNLVVWQQESGFTSWNAYRGDLSILRSTGVYTQAPSSNPVARRDCNLPLNQNPDPEMPGTEQAFFYLVTGTMPSGNESDLGTDSGNNVRPNHNACIPSSIVVDNFNEYTPGSVVGQGGWTAYNPGGSNFIVQSNVVFEGAHALYNNALGADSVVTKAGNPLPDGRQAFHIRTENRSLWGSHANGNVQVRVSKGSWAAGTGIFAAVTFKSNGNVTRYIVTGDFYQDFATYNDNEWTLLEIEWRSSDASARYRVNSGTWTAWEPFAGSASFTNFDYVGFDFDLASSAGGGAYIDTLQ